MDHLADIMRNYYIQGKEGIPLNGLEDLPDSPSDEELTGIAVSEVDKYLEIHNSPPKIADGLIEFHTLCLRSYLDGRAARGDSK